MKECVSVGRATTAGLFEVLEASVAEPLVPELEEGELSAVVVAFFLLVVPSLLWSLSSFFFGC